MPSNSMSKQPLDDLFYLSFANVACEVHAPKEWQKYFIKLYASTQLLHYSTTRPACEQIAAVTIHTANSRQVKLKFVTRKSLLEYDVYASDYPLFLFPSVHQCFARIFNILFHLAGGFVLHASSILMNDRVFIFAGESGRGKSTIADLFHQHFPESFILSDNSAFIQRKDNQFVLYPSPYMEANRVYEGRIIPQTPPPYLIQEIYFPFHAEKNQVTSLSFIEATQLIQKNSHIPYNPSKLFSPQAKTNFAKEIFDFIHTVSPQKLEFVKTKAFLYHIIRNEDKNSQ